MTIEGLIININPHFQNLMSDNTKRIFRGTAIVLIMMILTAGFGYLFRLILAKNLSLEEFGLFFAVFSFVNMFFAFKSFGTGPAFVKYITEYDAKKKPESIKKVILVYMFIQLVVFGILSFVILLLANYLSVNYFKDPKAFWIIILLTTGFFFSIFVSVFRGALQGFQKPGYFSTIEFVQTFLLVFFTLLFYNFGLHQLSPALAYLASFLLVSFWSFFLLLRVFPLLKVKASPDKKTFREIITFSIPITIASIISSILASEDTVILTYFRSLSEVGLYSIAIPTVSLIRYVPKALSTIIFPLSAELYFKAKNKLATTLTQMYKYLFIIVVPISLIFFSFSEEFINIFFGDKFIGATVAFKILSVAMIFGSIYTVNQNILIGVGKPKTYTKIILIEAILNTIFDLMLIPFFGIVGASLATCISSFFMLILSSINIKKHIKNIIPWKNWIIVFLCGYCVILVISFLKQLLNFTAWLELGIILPIAGCVYLTLILFTKTILPKEILSIFKGIKG